MGLVWVVSVLALCFVLGLVWFGLVQGGMTLMMDDGREGIDDDGI